ncbi:hypothetical protein TSTA_089920 [Talaromyces stipitatus ATCC 10500]|uniref:Helitron helicase-like domain-containing protein n=1 Tax=Talaromyces stipitatus (strain ATCC 10500 / CBS 375.48 / QM 6759 / NRRL 1006) TaxID=441959 RepID=B8M0X3_TALSN|nr:uncharacterized protein TSTA_089920 [Talaromyces stipitatus ATCC 10500]EED21753.1 hypothetical protein TSTA_089920 [Talaromyces stipitatus ATCC 10500]
MSISEDGYRMEAPRTTVTTSAIRPHDVSDQVVNESIDPVNIDPNDTSKEIELPERSAVPDLLAQGDELTAIRDQLQPESGHAHLEVSLFRSTPLIEFNRTQPLLSWAFPTLFPRGEAEFTTPRQRTVSFEDYIKHLMKFRDGRFARHPRFRYVVFNTLMRQCDGANLLGLTDDLRNAFADEGLEADALLKAMVKNIGPAHLFLTLSAADLHWDDLMRHLPRYQEWKNGTATERIHISWENLCDNPHIVANWFHIRFSSFCKEVLDKKFNVVDFWF